MPPPPPSLTTTAACSQPPLSPAFREPSSTTPPPTAGPSTAAMPPGIRALDLASALALVRAIAQPPPSDAAVPQTASSQHLARRRRCRRSAPGPAAAAGLLPLHGGDPVGLGTCPRPIQFTEAMIFADLRAVPHPADGSRRLVGLKDILNASAGARDVGAPPSSAHRSQAGV